MKKSLSVVGIIFVSVANVHCSTANVIPLSNRPISLQPISSAPVKDNDAVAGSGSSQDSAPAQDSAPTQDSAPAKDSAPMQDSAPTQDSAPMQVTPSLEITPTPQVTATPVPPSGPQVSTLNEIAAEVNKTAPTLVDPTGNKMELPTGLVVGVVTPEGKKVLGFGSTQMTNGALPNGDTLFAIGSVTKVFTGLILADAVKKGIVGLDDSANKHLAFDLQLPSNAITLRHLVTHTSGLDNFPANIGAFRDLDNDGVNDSSLTSPGRNYSRQLLAEWLASKPQLKFQPGTNVLYSNAGAGILGVLLQEKMKYASFNEMARTRISLPLGMKLTAAYTAELQQLAGLNQAQGYFPSQDAGALVPVSPASMGVLAASGELMSSPNNMLVFLQGMAGLLKTALAPAFEESGRALVSALPSLGNDKMAYGAKIVASAKGGSYFYKTGETAGHSAVILWRNDAKIGIVILSNRGKFEAANKWGRELMETLVH
ncbi:MAG: hypothetical protein RIR26_748 [Pseudomonadota bacterium]